MKKHLLPLFTAVAIPLSGPDGWQNLKFSGIPANQVRHTGGGLEIEVHRSSSPLIYPLKNTLAIASFRVDLEVEGAMSVSGSGAFPEDAYLRLGLVAPGSRRMNRMERMFAAAWVKKLFDLAPEGSGIDKIHFYDLTQDPSYLGREREFPKSIGLMAEHLVAAREKDVKRMTFQYRLPAPQPTRALWISVDGDDTKSDFKLTIKSLILETAEN